MASRSKQPPLPPNTYHSVPDGWSIEEVVTRYKTLRGPLASLTVHDISPAAPNLTPAQQVWLGYVRALSWIADGVSRGDHACVELAVRYITLDHFGSGSGYMRAKLARRLKHAGLDRQQQSRLWGHFEKLCQAGTRRFEFRQYRTLWQRIVTADEWMALAAKFPFLDRQSPADQK